MDSLSYEEYFSEVQEMIHTLKEHWQAEQRVKSLKVAIQLSKLLANSNQMRLYAKKYKMITDTLNEFGDLINQRIQAKAVEIPQNLVVVPPTPTSNGSLDAFLDSQRELAKETCRNWFLKIASIRELVPRFYAELAILKSCDILLKSNVRGIASIEEQFYAQSLRRLTKTAWGFGDPIVAIHARVYLCRVAVKLMGWSPSCGQRSSILFDIILANLKANATLISHLDAATMLRVVQAQNVDMMVFFDLISNAMQANVGCVLESQDFNEHQRHQEEDSYLTMDDATDNINQPQDQPNEQAMQRQRLMLNCLLDQIEGESPANTSPAEICSILSCNILLHSTFRSLSAEVVAENCERSLRLIQFKVLPKWRSFCDKNSTQMGDLQSITQTLYQALGAFGLALDASEQPIEAHVGVASKVELRDDENQGGDLTAEANKQKDQQTNPSPLAKRVLVQMDDVIEEVLKFELHHIDPQALSLHYLRCFTAWFSYANHYGDSPEVDGLLKRFVTRIRANRQFVAHHKVLIELVKILFTNRKTLDEFASVFRLKSFAQLFDLLRRDDHKLEASKWILETMRANLKLEKLKSRQNPSNQEAEDKITNRETINFLLRLFATINDSISLLAMDDHIDHLAEVIIYFLDRIQVANYRDHLNFLSKCRGSMGNLNPILVHLCHRVLSFAIEFRSVERKRNARQDYLNGCLAFTYVTIPAINNFNTRFDLLLEGSQLALKHMSLSLADYYVKQTLVNLADQMKSLQSASEQSNHLSIVPNSMASSSSSSSNNSATKKQPTNRRLLDQVFSLLKLILKFEDHIDLKHKLLLARIIKSFFSEQANLIESLEHLNLIDDLLDAPDTNTNATLTTKATNANNVNAYAEMVDIDLRG